MLPANFHGLVVGAESRNPAAAQLPHDTYQCRLSHTTRVDRKWSSPGRTETTHLAAPYVMSVPRIASHARASRTWICLSRPCLALLDTPSAGLSHLVSCEGLPLALCGHCPTL
eukprot:3146497-Rhodomonas_salina.5